MIDHANEKLEGKKSSLDAEHLRQNVEELHNFNNNYQCKI